MSTEDYTQFIEMVLGEQVGVAVMGLRDRPGSLGKVNRYTDFQYPAQLAEMSQFAADHRNEDLYISPLIYGEERNADNGKVRRTPENALTSQTIYQDSDTCAPENFRLVPTIHITSSSGRYQDFWVLSEPIPAREAAEISHRIAVAHRDQGSDPSSWSANKVLRVPYSVNTSHGFPEAVDVEFTANVYDALDISGAYDDIEIVERPIIRLPAEVSYESDDDLPDYADALDKLPPSFNLSNLTSEVPDGVDRSRMRYRLLCDLFRTGIDFDDVLSLAWSAPVSRKWKEDARNIRGLIAEALKAQLEVSYESGTGIEAPAAEERGSSQLVSAVLLSDSERDGISGDENWLRDWDDWNRRKLDRAYNGPYVRMNGVLALSAAFSDLGYIPMSNGPENCNLYGIAIGDSGTGKSSSLKLWYTMMKEIFPHDSGWDIGSNSSPNALHEVLIQRDQKVSVFNDDEAHGWFSTINTQQWASGTYQALAKYYDGRVPPMLRTGNREVSGKSAETVFLMLLYGTMKGELSITNVLNRSMFLSGFLARFIWCIGDTRVITQEALEETQSNGERETMGYEPWARQWAAEFENTKKKLRIKTKQTRIAMRMDDDALRRMGQLKWSVHQMYQKHPQWEILEPSLIRFGVSVRKLATLLAMQEGHLTVSLRHLLVAISYAEEWLTSMVTMTELISDSEWKRLCDEVMTFVQSRGERVKREIVYRKFASRKGKELNEQIADLVQQGLMEERSEQGSKWLVPKV